jgi:sec-independent protein translocase protein TatA
VPFGIGPLEIVIVLAIALLILGPRKLPQIGRGLGSGMREFSDGIRGVTRPDPPAAAVEPSPEVSPRTDA